MNITEISLMILYFSKRFLMHRGIGRNISTVSVNLFIYFKSEGAL